MKRICIQWPHFGPYHLARIKAAHQYFAERDVALIGLETAGDDTAYAWRVETAAVPFAREQLFPGAIFEDLSPQQVYQRVDQVLDRLQPDAVAINSYSLPDALACLAWCRRHRRTAVVMTDSKADDAPRTGWREALKALLVRQFDAALLAGTPQRRYFLDLGFPDDAIFLGYDVVDNDFFRKGAARARCHPDQFRALPGLGDATPFFLASSRFIARKNLDGLLHAYTLYQNQSERPWRLVLLGDGPERRHLEALVQAHDLTGVTFAGFRQIDELPAYYGLASAFVHPAQADQWGLVVNEAMASGLPVLVSTRAGCASNLVHEGANGFRFPPDDHAALARLLRRMASPDTDPAALGRCSQTIITGWSLERFAEELWHAVQMGHTRSARPFSPAARGLLWVLRYATRSMRMYHSIKD